MESGTWPSVALEDSGTHPAQQERVVGRDLVPRRQFEEECFIVHNSVCNPTRAEDVCAVLECPVHFSQSETWHPGKKKFGPSFHDEVSL